jgi:hypothetical protein
MAAKPPETVYLQLSDDPTTVPVLIREGGNNAGSPVHPIGITIGGEAATFDGGTLSDGNPASRVNNAGESDRLSIEVTFDPVAAGLAPGDYPMVATFRGPNNTTRTFNATNTYTVP